MPPTRTTRATMPSAARTSSAWCATGCRKASRARASARLRSAGSTRRPAMPGRMRMRRSRRRLLSRPRLAHELLELAALQHLERDVATADQLALDVELRVSRPVGVALERLAHLRLLEDVHGAEAGAHGPQRRDCLRRKSALGEIRRALHKQHHRTRG